MNKIPESRKPNNLIRSFLKNNYLVIIISIIFFMVFYIIALQNYLLYHSLIELFSISIAITIFIIAWNSKKIIRNNYLLFLGISYIFIALFDLLHTLSYKGMNIFTGFLGSNLATQLWISARYIESISILLALLFITKRFNYKIQLAWYSLITALILLSIFYWKIFPVGYIEGSGLTSFKIISEYIISFILLIAIIFLFIRKKELNRRIFTLITASLFITVLSELSFTLYVDVYGLFSQLGHFLKILSFFLIYKAIVETGFSDPINLLFFKLKQSEAKYRILFKNMTQPFLLGKVILNEKGKPIDYIFLEINKSWEKLNVVSKEKVAGKRAFKIFSKPDSYWLEIFGKVALTGESKIFEQFDVKNKKWFTALIYSPKKDQFAVILEDRTEKRKSEKVLKKSQEKFMDLANSITDIYFAMDSNLNYTFCNVAYSSLIGYKSKDLIGKSWFDFDINKRYKWIAKKYIQVITTGIPESFETSFEDSKGIIYHTINAYPARDGIIVENEDITQRKIIEEEIRKNKEFTETALNAQTDTFFLFDPVNKKAIRWNQAFNKISGYTDEEIIRMPVPDSYYSPEDLERTKTFLENTPMSGNGTIELDFICKNNSIVPTEYRISTIKDGKGNPKYLISVGRDITERKIAEKLHFKKEKERIVASERDHLAHELHDTVAQTLFSANLIAGVIPGILKKNPKIAMDKLKEVKKLNSTALAEMRILLLELKPLSSKKKKLGNLLKNLADSISSSSKIPIIVTIDEKHKNPIKIELIFYRIS